MHCFYSVYLTPVQRGEEEEEEKEEEEGEDRVGGMEALAVQNIRKAQKVGNHDLAKNWTEIRALLCSHCSWKHPSSDGVVQNSHRLPLRFNKRHRSYF